MSQDPAKSPKSFDAAPHNRAAFLFAVMIRRISDFAKRPWITGSHGAIRRICRTRAIASLLERDVECAIASLLERNAAGRLGPVMTRK